AREWLLNRLEAYFFEGERVLNSTTDSTENTDKNAVLKSIREIQKIRGSFPAGVQPALVSTSQFAAVVETDHAFLQVAEVYTGNPAFSVPKLVRELVESESVPFLPCQRYKESGLRKSQDWQHVWELQREEDRISAEKAALEQRLNDRVRSCLEQD